MSKGKKHLDFELNLVPFIDLLSVCICFLLLTAVWLHLGSMDVKQAVGGQAATESARKPTMWVRLAGDGALIVDVQDAAKVPGHLRKFRINGVSGKPDLDRLAAQIGDLKVKVPDLTTALLQPQAQAVYEDIIDVMDQFKKLGLNDVGVAPL